MWNIERVLRLANSSLRRCSVHLHNELFRFLRALTEHTKAVCKFMVIVRLFQLRTISLHHLLWTSASIDWECEFEDPKKIDNKIIAQRLPWTRYAANSSNSVEVPDFKRKPNFHYMKNLQKTCLSFVQIIHYQKCNRIPNFAKHWQGAVISIFQNCNFSVSKMNRSICFYWLFHFSGWFFSWLNMLLCRYNVLLLLKRRRKNNSSWVWITH